MLHTTRHFDHGLLTSVDVADDVANTFTTFNGQGAQIAQRALTAAEIQRYADAAASAAAAAAQAATVTGLQTKAQNALATNISALALPDPTAANQTYIALNPPTNLQVMNQVDALSAQVNALVAQVTALTKQNNALIRLGLGLLDSTDGT